MGHFLLRYTVAADYRERRTAFRAVHLAHAQAAVARGELLLGGAVETSAPGDAEIVEALLLFTSADPGVAEAFAKADPYVVNGLVTAWRVDRWMTVVGEQAAETIPA